MKEYYDFGGTLYALPFRQGCRHLSSSVVICCCHYVAFSLFYIVFWTISMVQGCRHLRSSVVVFAVIL